MWPSASASPRHHQH
ncbi:hypothetical protein GQ600_22514 [Phytophthora cactorum]|nr:hypothetical protein GQ600_22514 [Phytophthora cactorum]